ncbi:MAG: uncharacterized protein QOJ13_688 [Gaiellales bacterium]|nr:uncharacterized protein [Gaiellales bacterium]
MSTLEDVYADLLARVAEYPTPGVTLVKNVRIPTRDGTHLHGDLYFPTERWERREAVPIVLEYIPYRKDDTPPGGSFYDYLAQRGYGSVRVDIRGTGASEGVSRDEYLLEEQLDGVDAIEWIAKQAWCTGHVNMMGASYGGFTSLQIASHAPESLTSIIPIYFTDDRYTDDCHYRGGLMRKYYDVSCYGNMMVAWNALPADLDWLEEWADVWEQHLEGSEPYLLQWMRHQTDGDYWRNGSVGDAPERIQCPVFMIGGWRDGYPNPPLRLFSGLRAPKKVLIGPWNHSRPDTAVPGPRIDYLHEVVRWLDHWCKGEQNGVMDEPPVVVYMQEGEPPDADRLDSRGEWRAETSWPVAGATEETLYLADGGRLTAQTEDEAADALTYDPTVGTSGGLWSGGLPMGLPGDQRPDEALSLTYTTPPLEDDLHVLGRPRVHLHVSSSASVIGFAASLSDVGPDGQSHLVAKGMLNVTRRDSLNDPSPLVPGEIVELEIDVDTLGWVFRTGHRLRVAIANADWPNVWPTPYPAESEVHHGAARPSRITLPVVPAQGTAEAPAFRPSPVEMQRNTHLVTPPTWRVSRDALSGRAQVDLSVESSERINPGFRVDRTFEGVLRADPKDPARASAFGRHSSRLIRSLGTTEAVSDLFIQGSPTSFHVTLTLTVTVDDTTVFTRRWNESVPRMLL